MIFPKSSPGFWLASVIIEVILFFGISHFVGRLTDLTKHAKIKVAGLILLTLGLSTNLFYLYWYHFMKSRLMVRMATRPIEYLSEYHDGALMYLYAAIVMVVIGSLLLKYGGNKQSWRKI